MPDTNDVTVDRIYDALDAGDPELALQRAREALAESDEEEPVLVFLAGVCLLELDRPAEAVERLRHAVTLDEDDFDYRTQLAVALFRACRFSEGEVEARRVVDAGDTNAEAHEALALLLERRGAFDEADRHLARAAELDSERFPRPRRLSRKELDEAVARAEERLPEKFRRHLDEVAVTVEALPAEEILLQESPPLDPELLGLFVGVALSDRTSFGPGGDLPPRILLFQRNLERYAAGSGNLLEEIEKTLYHELGHYLGFDEEGLEDLDLA